VFEHICKQYSWLMRAVIVSFRQGRRRLHNTVLLAIYNTAWTQTDRSMMYIASD
jgi:hypothetical protein